MIKLIAPDGQKIVDMRTGKLHDVVICSEDSQKYFAVSDSDDEITVEPIPGHSGNSSLADRVSTIEDELTATKILLGVE